jgi:hypothetical protein
MSEAPVSRGITRRFYYWVASAPFPLCERSLLPRRCCSTARLPPIDRRPLGFALPPHDGFALLASTHGCACLATVASYTGHQRRATPPGGLFAQRNDASGGLLCVTLPPSLMPALLPRGDEF